MWLAGAVATVILLIVYWKSKNAVWGGLSYGIVFGLIWAIGTALFGDGFNFSYVGKAIVVGVIIGFLAEMLGKFSKSKKSEVDDKNNEGTALPPG